MIINYPAPRQLTCIPYHNLINTSLALSLHVHVQIIVLQVLNYPIRIHFNYGPQKF